MEGALRTDHPMHSCTLARPRPDAAAKDRWFQDVSTSPASIANTDGQRARLNDVAVIGGGIVGLATAVESQLAGLRTLLIDADGPIDCCSFGNAGLIATSEIHPLSSIGRILNAPRMMADPLGPLAIRGRDIGSLTPWLARFALAARPAQQRRATSALAELNRRAIGAWRELLDACNGRDLLVEHGMIEISGSHRGFRSLRRRHLDLLDRGIETEILHASEVDALEPLLAGRTRGGLFHPTTAHVASPRAVWQALFRSFTEAGGRRLVAKVHRLKPCDGGCAIEAATSTLIAKRAVVTAGVWSGALLHPLGAVAPIEAERGYHLMLPEGLRPARPIMFHDESFVATPLREGLRLAGTVEMARSCAAPNWARAEQLLGLAGRYLPTISGQGASRWIGRRPSFPDSLPAIGGMRSHPSVLYAFGHQHLGLTQAAITAKSVLALLQRRAPPIDLAPYSLERFSKLGGRS